MCRRSWQRTALPAPRLSRARPGCGAGTTRNSPWAGRRRLSDALSFAGDRCAWPTSVALAKCTSWLNCQVFVQKPFTVLACVCLDGILASPIRAPVQTQGGMRY